MEQVKVRTFLQSEHPGKRCGAEYIRSTGERVPLINDVMMSEIKLRVEKLVYECEWELIDPSRGDGTIDQGTAWVDEHDAESKASQ